MKWIRFVQTMLSAAVLLVLGLLVYGMMTVPDEIVTIAQETPARSNGIYSVQSLSASDETEPAQTNYPVRVQLFHTIPVKISKMTVNRRQYAVVSGEIFGLRLYTSGVVIVSTEKVETPQGEVYPADQAGLKKGDIILTVNGEPVRSHTELSRLFSEYLGTPMKIGYERGGEARSTTFAPAYSEAQGRYMAGLWVRDSAAGIGTMTFYDPESGVYGGLGHAVCDVDTGEVLPLYNGDIVAATITGCYKGTAGQAGELIGSFQSESIGSLLRNDADGVYGFLEDPDRSAALTPVALKSEVQTGEAQIIATVDETGPQQFSVEIEKITPDDPQYRNMIVRVTDPRLLEITGGIVQGMSGSPVLQNGRLVGAITHVFVNEPQRGYAIFAQQMTQKANDVAESVRQLAS